MGDEYQDLVELGFEGVDHFASKYHDTVYGYADKHKPRLHKKKHHRNPEPPRARSEPPDERGFYNTDEEDRGMNAPERRRERDRRDDGGKERAYMPDERAYYPGPDAGAVVGRDREASEYPGRYEVAPRAAAPPYGYAPQPYDARYEDDWRHDRGRPRPVRRRSSSWSPPRYSEKRRDASSSRRSRSKDPNHHIVPTIVGAVAGGIIGNRVSAGAKSTMGDEPNILDKLKAGDKLATFAGAVMGGIATREFQKAVYRRKGREAEEEELRQQRHEERRKERERGYGY